MAACPPTLGRGLWARVCAWVALSGASRNDGAFDCCAAVCCRVDGLRDGRVCAFAAVQSADRRFRKRAMICLRALPGAFIFLAALPMRFCVIVNTAKVRGERT